MPAVPGLPGPWSDRTTPGRRGAAAQRRREVRPQCRAPVGCRLWAVGSWRGSLPRRGKFPAALRHDAERHAGTAEVGAGHPLHVGRGDRAHPREVLGEVVGLAGVVVVVVELVGLGVHVLETAELVRFEGVPRLVELARRGPLGGEPGELPFDDPLEGVERSAGAAGRDDGEVAVPELPVLEGEDPGGDLPLVDEGLGEAAVLGPGEEVAQDVRVRWADR